MKNGESHVSLLLFEVVSTSAFAESGHVLYSLDLTFSVYWLCVLKSPFCGDSL